MSNQLTGNSVSARHSATRELDLCDLYAFQAPAELPLAGPSSSSTPIPRPTRSSRRHLPPQHRQWRRLPTSRSATCSRSRKTASRLSAVLHAQRHGHPTPEAVGTKIVGDAEVLLGPKPNIVKAGNITYSPAAAAMHSSSILTASRPVRHPRRQKLHRAAPHSGRLDQAVNSDAEADVFSTVIELRQNGELGPGDPNLGTMRPAPLGKLLHVDRAGQPQRHSFFNTNDAKETRQRAGQRSQALDRYVRPPDGAYRQLRATKPSPRST